jgi:putative tricarboxylic transport membrane protein
MTDTCRPDAARRALIRAAAAAALLPATGRAQGGGGAERPPAPSSPTAAAAAAAAAVDPSHGAAQCFIPAKAGGGFELTCGLARDALRLVRPERPPLASRYLPGGIGALAFSRIATGQVGGEDTLVAFSSGSLLNLAQGRFGPYGPSDVRWIAALGAESGVIAVRRDAPHRHLGDLLQALRRDMNQVVFGAGGTVGSQDWVKAALLVRAAGRDHKAMRFVSFEGGGDALGALKGGHVTVFTGDAAEALQAVAEGAPLHFLAVLSESRLPGPLADVPTAREQGADLVWRTVRGVYLSARTPPAAAAGWRRAFEAALSHPGYPALLSRYRLQAFARTGPALDAFVERSLEDYRALTEALGLKNWRR